MRKKICFWIAWVFCMLAILLVGVVLLKDRRYDVVSVLLMLLSTVPFFFQFETEERSASAIALLAVLTALSVVGRFLFAPLPFFKPVTAIVVLAGIYLGKKEGFLCGAASALISNFYFGQGPWTPFQMVAWGMIGFLAGVLAKQLKKQMWLLLVYGALAGILFSMMMDVWTSLWYDGTFTLERYLANVLTALPVTAIYMVSNVIFLAVLAKPLGKRIEHTLKKY